MGLVKTAPTPEQAKDSFAPASSFLELVEYDPQSRTMEVTFKSGSKHRYFMVFPATFAAFKQSPSHSAYYARAIKGNLISAKLIDHEIGRNDSTPLKHVTRKEPALDRGIRQTRARRNEQFGTINRIASNAAIA